MPELSQDYAQAVGSAIIRLFGLRPDRKTGLYETADAQLTERGIARAVWRIMSEMEGKPNDEQAIK